jgi:hypothetical protein
MLTVKVCLLIVAVLCLAAAVVIIRATRKWNYMPASVWAFQAVAWLCQLLACGL